MKIKLIFLFFLFGITIGKEFNELDIICDWDGDGKIGGWIENDDRLFDFPKDLKEVFQGRFSYLRDRVKNWQIKLAKKCENDTHFHKKYQQYFFEDRFNTVIPNISWNKDKQFATRESFGKILEQWGENIPNLIGGSADLEPSNMTEDFAKLSRASDIDSKRVKLYYNI